MIYMSLVSNFESPRCRGQVFLNSQTKVFTLRGQCNGSSLRYVAAAPPDFRDSYMGSGLPFPTEDMAYDNTQNKGDVAVVGGKFEFSIVYPNAYYINGGSTMVNPHVNIVVDGSDMFTVKLGEPLVPNRSLKHLPGRTRRTAGSSYGTNGGRG